MEVFIPDSIRTTSASTTTILSVTKTRKHPSQASFAFQAQLQPSAQGATDFGISATSFAGVLTFQGSVLIWVAVFAIIFLVVIVALVYYKFLGCNCKRITLMLNSASRMNFGILSSAAVPMQHVVPVAPKPPIRNLAVSSIPAPVPSFASIGQSRKGSAQHLQQQPMQVIDGLYFKTCNY